MSLAPRIASVVPLSGQPMPADFDWALHPGGIKVLTSCQKVLGLSVDHLRASYDVYKTHGNSSGATIFSVLNRLRLMGEGRDNVVACAFGPGIAIEMAILRRVRDAPVHTDVFAVSPSASDSE
jgi:fungal type III polyketide synthase